jgi:hypothetical protein
MSTLSKRRRLLLNPFISGEPSLNDYYWLLEKNCYIRSGRKIFGKKKDTESARTNPEYTP